MSTLMVQTVPKLEQMEIELPESMRITPTDFAELCSKNENLNAELSSDGDLIILAPRGGNAGWRNSMLTAALALWERQHQDGMAFDSSTVFLLPNGALRGPDAAWVRSERWEALSKEQQDGFPPLCPDFVIELRSKSDRLPNLQAKMDEYVSNGSVLGFLIDPGQQTVHIYRPNQDVETLTKPEQLRGDPELPGLVIDLTKIW